MVATSNRVPASRGVTALALATLCSASFAQTGVYAPVELRKREPNDLIDTAAQYHDLFDRRSLLYGEERVNTLVRRIGRELAPPPTDDYIEYRFFVLRDPSPNAFAFPNGDTYVHTGMLARLTDESQLAALLAHEINHVAGHHGVLSYRITAARLTIQIFTGGLASLMGQLRYSRQLEQEADDRAPDLMRAAGYDPRAMPELLDVLGQDFEGLDPRIPTVWTTHPDPEDRAARSRIIVADMPRSERHPNEFETTIYSLRAMTIRDYIQDDYPYTAIALAEDFLADHPDDSDFRQLLGDAWRVLGPRAEFAPEELSKRESRRRLRQRVWQTREERVAFGLETEQGKRAFAANLEQARSTYQDILDRDPDYVAAHRGLGQVYEALGQPRSAAREYLAYVRAAPDAADRTVIVTKLTELRDQIQQQEIADERH